jgi:tetratricopeptide (TPR) repeat protein
MARLNQRRACLIALLLAAGWPAAAHAGDGGAAPEAQRAEELAARAFELYKEGHFREAVELYAQAEKLVPAAAVLFNIARIYDQKLRQRPRAIDYYRRALEAPDVEPELAARVRTRLATLQAEVATPPPTRAAPARPSAPSPRGASWLPAAGAAAVGGGALGLGVGTFFGLKAVSKNRTAGESCTGRDCTNPRALTLTAEARDDARVSTVGFVAGGALLVGGLALLLAPRGASSPSALAPSPRWLLAPALGPRGGGLVVALGWP